MPSTPRHRRKALRSDICIRCLTISSIRGFRSRRGMIGPWWKSRALLRRDRLRPRTDRLPRAAGVLLPDPRSDDEEPAGQRCRHQLPLGDLLRRRRAASSGAGHHRRCRGLRAVAGQGRHRGQPRTRLLGSRTGAPGLPGALPGWLHLPLPAAGLEAAQAHRGLIHRTAVAVAYCKAGKGSIKLLQWRV
mgnify:CR=1 FL=1